LEPNHLDQPVDRRAVTTQLQPAARVPRQCDDPQINLGRQPAVEPYFGYRIAPSRLDRSEVEACTAGRFLQFEGMRTGQKHPGKMRLHYLDPALIPRVTIWVTARIAEKADLVRQRRIDRRVVFAAPGRACGGVRHAP